MILSYDSRGTLEHLWFTVHGSGLMVNGNLWFKVNGYGSRDKMVD